MRRSNGYLPMIACVTVEELLRAIRYAALTCGLPRLLLLLGVVQTGYYYLFVTPKQHIEPMIEA